MHFEPKSDTVADCLMSISFITISIVMNWFKAIDAIDAVYVTPLLHVLQFVSLFIGISAALATISPTFKTKADALVKRVLAFFKL